MTSANVKDVGITSANAPNTHYNEQRDFACEDGAGKAFATMQAQAALAGCTLIELADGGFLVGRWNYNKASPCLRDVGDMLRQIGGR